MKFRKLLSYKLDNDTTLEYSTTVKGMGRAQIALQWRGFLFVG